MAAHGVKTLIYSSTCATYGEPEKMPITEVTPQVSNIDVSLAVYVVVEQEFVPLDISTSTDIWNFVYFS